MPVSINIDFDTKDLSKALKSLGKDGVSKALNSALNKTVGGAFTDAKRLLQDHIGLRNQKTIKRRTKVFKSTRSKLSARLEFTEDNIPLSALKNVKAQGFGRKSKVSWKGRQVRGAFKLKNVTTKGSGGAELKSDIWLSGTKARYKSTGNRKIYRAYGYTLLQEYRYHKIHDKLRKPVNERFRKAWVHSFERESKKYGFFYRKGLR